MNETFYTVSVLPGLELDNRFQSIEAACAVAWDTWRPGFEIGIRKHDTWQHNVGSELITRININGVWSAP